MSCCIVFLPSVCFSPLPFRLRRTPRRVTLLQAPRSSKMRHLSCRRNGPEQGRPSLNGLFGRTAGTHPNFAYSQAMQDAGKAGLVWSETSLRDYLHDPKAKVKGTKMAFAGLKDDTDITNLIAYLKQYSK